VPRTVITLINPTLVVADTQVGLDTGTAYECQLTSAALVPTPVSNTVPATGCAPASSVPGRSTWELQLAWLQDWSAAGGGLSNYAIEHETELVWYRLELETTGAVAAEGQAYVVAGQYGGEFGGPPAAATANWPCADTPAFTTPVTAAAATESGSSSSPATSSSSSATPAAV